MTPSPNVEALERIMQDIPHLYGSWDEVIRNIAWHLASRGVLATEALTDGQLFSLSLSGENPEDERPTFYPHKFRSALARLARGEP